MAFINERGNTVNSEFSMLDSYHYHELLVNNGIGWIRYFTKQDSNYFGVWVNQALWKIFTFCEGDAITISCSDEKSFDAEMGHMVDFYDEI
jgi:hypothetical protein